ncbi:MAG: hypothetical protein LBO08_00620 [Rickettsiales bacterium]|jgi:hypothetical protein|nr:hypothetical protein [Rickettsiales bacterium]
MMKKNIIGIIFTFHFSLFTLSSVYADEAVPTTAAQQLQAEFAAGPSCEQTVLAAALVENQGAVSEDMSDIAVRGWIYQTFRNAAAAKKLLECEKTKNMQDLDELDVPSIVYRFPGGREITTKYTAVKKLLTQRVMLGDKRNAAKIVAKCKNSDIECIDPNNGTIWLNSEPSWYGIMVVQAGSLNDFIGDENASANLISMKYIEQNQDLLYPKNSNHSGPLGSLAVATSDMCTSMSGWADSEDIVNIAALRAAVMPDGEKNGNQYYVAGDVDLRWVGYTELVADVALTVVTFGGSQAVSAGIKGIRAGRMVKNLKTGLTGLRKLPHVIEYEKATNAVLDAQRAVAKSQKAIKEGKLFGRDLVEAEKVVADGAGKIKELEKAANALKTADKTGDIVKMEKSAEQLREAYKLVIGLNKLKKAWQVKQTGNVMARGAKATAKTAKAAVQTIRALNKANKVIKKGNKVARAAMSTKSAVVKDWIFSNALRFTGATARLYGKYELLDGALDIAKDFWDITDVDSSNMTSNINFKPFNLLSADDIADQTAAATGQEVREINYGLWLMFLGHSSDPRDDDAAYLQAMDFAAKFSEEMEDVTDEELERGRSQSTMCNVDVFVVRPIVKMASEDDENPELYYLIMNSIPWQIRAE